MQPNNNQAATTDYNTAYAEFGNVYDPQVQAAQAQQAQVLQAKNTALAQLDQDKTTSLSQLDQAKVNAFKDNATTANARGLTFSGYTPYTNNAYVTNTYNPNVDKVNTNYSRNVDNTNTTYTQNNQSLLDKITAINQQRANDANSLVLNTQQANEAAAEKATRASTSATKAAQPTTAQISAAISSNLAKVTGRDGYVAPEDYAQAYVDWINSGGSTGSFNSNFGRYKNPNNGYYNYAITQALKRG